LKSRKQYIIIFFAVLFAEIASTYLRFNFMIAIVWSIFIVTSIQTYGGQFVGITELSDKRKAFGASLLTTIILTGLMKAFHI